MKLFKHKFSILLFSLLIITQIYSIVSYGSIQISKNEIRNNLNSYSKNAKQEAFLSSANTNILNTEEMEILTLINNYRIANNQKPLYPVKSLQEIAYTKANDLVYTNVFSHTSPNFGSTFNLMEQKQVLYNIAGENLAGNISGQKAVEAWINSQTHKDNILTDSFEYTGIAIVDSKLYGKVFVQIFIG